MITDCGRLYLEPNEMVTIVNRNGKEYDLCARSWGFYATPSVNGRLVREGFCTALVRNRTGKVFVIIVEQTAREQFDSYLLQESSRVIEWLDERPLDTEEISKHE